MEQVFFLTGLSLILMHEMDAIRCKEWRIFPGLHLLNDRWGLIVFIFLHIPLFAFLFQGLLDPASQAAYIRGLDIFFLIHLGLHLLFLLHPKNEFKDWISWSIIAGAGVFGLLDLVL